MKCYDSNGDDGLDGGGDGRELRDRVGLRLDRHRRR